MRMENAAANSESKETSATDANRSFSDSDEAAAKAASATRLDVLKIHQAKGRLFYKILNRDFNYF